MNDNLDKYFKPNLTKAGKRGKEKINYLKFNLPNEFKKIGLGKKYIVQTYGCQANEVDGGTIKAILELMGFKETINHDKADIIILNTCAIRENAEDRIWGELGRLSQYKKQNPNLIIGLCGCMAQEPKTIENILKKYKYVDLVFGTHNIFKLPEYIKDRIYSKEKVIEVFSKEGNIIENLPINRIHKHKAFVNIMYGCDEFCTYCIVPYTRGKERSRKPEFIIKEVNDLVKKGYMEVTLLGQNVDAYGQDFKNNYLFSNLLYDLSKTNIKRIRFTTSHPKDLTLETIKAMAKIPQVMPHLHLPVQSGSDFILNKMNRHYDSKTYLTKIKQLKKLIPDISLTTDIIVGFPGESKKDFNKTLKLIKKVKYEGAFTFIYSPRKGTPAASFLDTTPLDEKKKRLYKLNKIINKGYLKGNKRFLNKVVEVLVDGPSKNNPLILQGYSKHNKLVNFKGDNSLIGKLVNVKIKVAKSWSLEGEYIGEKIN